MQHTTLNDCAAS